MGFFFQVKFLRFIAPLLMALEALIPLAANADMQESHQIPFPSGMQRGFILAEYAYFDESLDVLDYADRLNSTFRPQQAVSSYVGVGYRALDNLVVSYQRERSKGEIRRDREPFLLRSEVDGDRLGLHWKFGKIWDFDWSLQLAYSKRKQPEVTLSCYDYQGQVFGSCPGSVLTFADPDTDEVLPLLTSSAEESGWLTALYARHNIFGRIELTHHVSVKRADLEVKSVSPLFDIQSSFLLNASFGGRKLSDIVASFKRDLPQSAPWQATTYEYGAKGIMSLAPKWTLTAQLIASKTSRSGYQQLTGVPNYENNVVLTSSIWFTPARSVSVYLEGMITKHYLLGIDEMTYNQRTSKFFEHPFAQLRVGLIYGF